MTMHAGRQAGTAAAHRCASAGAGWRLRRQLSGVAFVAFVAFQLVFSADACAMNRSPAGVAAVSRSVEFLLEQDNRLSRIETTFPELAGQVANARRRFDAAFPEVRVRLARELDAAMGLEKSQLAVRDMQSRTGDAVARQPMPRERALAFLQLMAGRAHGENIDSPVIEYLLAARYETAPANELADGHRRRFRTDGAGRAHGVPLSVAVPRSWKVQDGTPPDVLRSWTSEAGNGNEHLLLRVAETGVPEPSAADVEELVRSGEAAADAVPRDMRATGSGTFALDTRTGFWVEYEGTRDRGGLLFHERVRHQQVFVGSRAVSLQCRTVGRADAREQLNLTFRRLGPLCRQVVQTLTLRPARGD